MRTTLDIDDDVLQMAKELARAEKKTAGAVISDLARKALTRVFTTIEEEPLPRAEARQAFAALLPQLALPSAPLPFVDPDARDLCNRATAVASSHDGRFAPEEAIDGVPGSMWRAAGRAPAWWCADLGEVQPVLGVTLVAAMAPATGRVHHVVETCEGGEDWQVRATLEQVMTDAAVYAVGFASPVAARWVRVRTEATPSAYVGWAEIGIFG